MSTWPRRGQRPAAQRNRNCTQRSRGCRSRVPHSSRWSTRSRNPFAPAAQRRSSRLRRCRRSSLHRRHRPLPTRRKPLRRTGGPDRSARTTRASTTTACSSLQMSTRCAARSTLGELSDRHLGCLSATRSCLHSDADGALRVLFVTDMVTHTLRRGQRAPMSTATVHRRARSGLSRPRLLRAPARSRAPWRGASERVVGGWPRAGPSRGNARGACYASSALLADFLCVASTTTISAASRPCLSARSLICSIFASLSPSPPTSTMR